MEITESIWLPVYLIGSVFGITGLLAGLLDSVRDFMNRKKKVTE